MRAVHWFRNDLRLHDNTALSAAAARADELVPVFVFDDHLLGAVHPSPPRTRGERFDARGRYVRRWVPELRDVPDRFVHRPWEAPSPPRDYPPPIVDHAERRVLAVARYEASREGGRLTTKTPRHKG